MTESQSKTVLAVYVAALLFGCVLSFFLGRKPQPITENDPAAAAAPAEREAPLAALREQFDRAAKELQAAPLEVSPPRNEPRPENVMRSREEVVAEPQPPRAAPAPEAPVERFGYGDFQPYRPRIDVPIPNNEMRGWRNGEVVDP